MTTRGYIRVSSLSQSENTSLDYQQSNIFDFDAGAVIYSDVASGKNSQRASLDKMLSEVDSGDTVVATKLDRLSRSTLDGLRLIEELLGRGVAVRVLDDNLVFDNSPSSKLLGTLLLAIAENERSLILERTSEGRRRAKANGVRFGRPVRITDEVKRQVLALRERGNLTVREICSIAGIGKTSYHEIVNEARQVS